MNHPRIQSVLAVLFIAWIFLHIGLFFYATETDYSMQFWPFIHQAQTVEETYDISEFLVYAMSPFAFLILLKIFFQITNHTSRYDPNKHGIHGFFIAFLEEKIRAEELAQKINELSHQPVNSKYLNELKADRDIAHSKGVKSWPERIAVKNKYKSYEKEYK